MSGITVQDVLNLLKTFPKKAEIEDFDLRIGDKVITIKVLAETEIEKTKKDKFDKLR